MGCRIREILTIITFLVPFYSSGQAYSSRLTELYKYVERTDSLLIRSQKTFYLEKFLEDNHNYRETWRFTQNGGKVVFFQVDYILDSTEFTEVYYLRKGILVCSEEYEKVNYSFLEDELKWGGIYYFESAIPRHVVMLGKKITMAAVLPTPGF